MLTSDLIKPFLRSHGNLLVVEHVEEGSLHWLQTAQEMIELFQLHLGLTRARWEEALEVYEGTRVDYLRIRGLAKVLTDGATFLPKVFPCAPRELRERLFCNGPVFERPDIFHPATRQEFLQTVAVELQISAEEVDEAIFSDHPGAHVLTRLGPDWTPEGLLQRYNLELARGALYRATYLQIEIYDHFKECWRYLKLFKLMFLAKELPDGGYQVTLSGPLSDFVETDRYGVAFAEFFPALLLGDRWNMVAKVKPQPLRQFYDSSPGSGLMTQDSQLLYRLDHTCGLQSHYRRGRLYDSGLERTFASEFSDFEDKFGTERGKWHLTREDQVLVLDGSVMIPDFLLVHAQDETRRILVELVGFWSPRYLKNKITKVQAARCPYLLLLVYEHLKVTKEDFGPIEGELIFFKEKPVIKEVMAAVEALAEKVYGPLVVPEKVPVAPPELAEILSRSIEAQATGEELWYSLEQLNSLLQQGYPAFTPRRYGYRSLSALVKDKADLFEVRRGTGKGHPIELRLLTYSFHS